MSRKRDNELIQAMMSSPPVFNPFNQGYDSPRNQMMRGHLIQVPVSSTPPHDGELNVNDP